ncbi:MAG TPA: S8 family serine peptidase, partial [Cytophagales bacterium]|nr:S8 family serine peptidase [Cytophagales bacterium]
MKRLLLIILNLLCLWIHPQTLSYSNANSYWAYRVLNIPTLKLTPPKKPIIVAVVDDGFRLSHNDLKAYIFQNTKEIPLNQKDDDNNGYIDDTQGWDISDNDPDASLPPTREHLFYHGTMVASAIISVVKEAYGDDSQHMLKVLPVKVLSSQAKNTYLADGYKGIRYAIDQG